MGITKTVREALAANERRVLASELSACVRSLDAADRRASADGDVVPYLAQAILQLDAAAKGIAAWRPKHAEPVDQFTIDEHKTLQRDVDEMIRKYLVRYGDANYARLGRVAWAKQVVKRLAQEKAQAEQRRTTRAAFKASGKCRRCGKQSDTLNTGDGICHSCFLRSQQVRGKTVIKRAPMAGEAVALVLTKMASGRPGFCDTCGKARERKTLQGLCPECIERHFPTLRR